ncbi:PREDICTED: allene oxide synthase-lipoxygenase protein-like [Branchiostoma belcheri]|uniref:Allene oxide synthase-lipoxygenase protein-like n=1 Tax=Branchiostoma belcheri TaxID=7741 RepID=A0A6P5AWT7_BRABE|nr:PREDICTED: allene oxide synthase-lipoxygenase protein-like [Branchiostoma belcheri]
MELYSTPSALGSVQPLLGQSDKVALQTKLQKLKIAAVAGTATAAKRAFHAPGIGASGFAVVVDKVKFPENDFFRPRTVFPVRLRHSNCWSADDAAADIRGAAIKFGDTDGDSCFEMVLDTGVMAPFWDLPSYEEYVAAMKGGPDRLQEWCWKGPMNYYIMVDSLRRAPDSYFQLIYHSQTCFAFRGSDNVPRLAKFRLIPTNKDPESGLLDLEQQRQVWNTARLPDEERPKDYLRHEYAERLMKASLKYRLQMQLHTKKASDTASICNPYRCWAPGDHPWYDVADVIITTLLRDNVIARTSFHIANLPPCLSLIEPESVYDYNSINYIRSKVYPAAHAARLAKLRGLPPLRGPIEYEQQPYSVEMRMGSKQGMPGLKGYLKGYKTGNSQVFSMTAADVGEVLMVTMYNEGGQAWFVESIVVEEVRRGRSTEFPAHRWITDMVMIRRGKAALLWTREEDVLLGQRLFEMQERRKQFSWRHSDTGFPGRLAASNAQDLPPDVRPSESMLQKLSGISDKLTLPKNILSCLWEKDKMENFVEFKKMVPEDVYNRHRLIKHLKSDAEFGRQFLDGFNPLALRRCRQLPEAFEKKTDEIEKQLTGGKSLLEEIEAGRVYVADYAALAGLRGNISGRDVFHLAAPTALFHLTAAGDMLPLAIQLYQKPGPHTTVWTPADPQCDWMLAKMFLRNADAQEWSVIDEVYSLGLKGRRTLIARASSEFSWRELVLPAWLHDRGLDKLPEFVYRDDAMKLWRASRALVDRIVSLYYESDQDLADDLELQAWIKDLHDNGFNWEKAHGENVPSKLSTQADLVDLVTGIMFNCSAQRRALTAGMRDIASFIPNVPFAMRAPPPTRAASSSTGDGLPDSSDTHQEEDGLTRANKQQLLAALPDRQTARKQIALAAAMSRGTDKGPMLGEYPGRYFTDEPTQAAITDFRRTLKKISRHIHQRNKKVWGIEAQEVVMSFKGTFSELSKVGKRTIEVQRDVPYNCLLPEHIPASIGP